MNGFFCLKNKLLRFFPLFFIFCVATSAWSADWTGEIDSSWNNFENWTGISTISDLETSDIKIPSGCTNYPIIEEDITVKSLEIKSGATLTSSKNISCTGKFNNSGTLSIQTLELNGTSAQTITVGTVTASGNFICKASTINFSGSVTVDGYIRAVCTRADVSNITIIAKKGFMLDGKLNYTGSSLSPLTFGSATDDSKKTDVYIFCPSPAEEPLYFGADNSAINITINGDLIIDTLDVIKIPRKSSIKVDNLVLYNGSLNLGASSSILAEKDIVLLGSKYDSQYPYKQKRLASCNLSRTDFSTLSTMPDGTLLSTIESGFAGSVTAAFRARLYAGKNFYANGVSLISSLKWYIAICDITDATKRFAECYKCDVKNCEIQCHDETSSSNNTVYMPAYNCNDEEGNTNWNFDPLEITNAYTVRDNVIYVEFNREIRNKNGELNGLLSYIKYGDRDDEKEYSFNKIYSDPDCQNEIPSNKNITNSFYLKASESWNTDATGESAGGELSTDRDGTHKSAKPYLKIPSSIGTGENQQSVLTDIWGTRIKDYTDDDIYINVEDKTGPVLYSVRAGQEIHEQNDGTAESQHSYDAHNFLEFRYSEPVNFSGTKNNVINFTENTSIIENIQVTNALGALSGTSWTNEGELTFSALATIQNGQIHTATAGRSDKLMNTLYRKDPYSLCISIAGYTKDEVKDVNRNTYKKWVGYIEKAITPSGTVDISPAVTAKTVTDLCGNDQEIYAVDNKEVTVNSEKDGIYGEWDVTAPGFAPVRYASKTWNKSLISGNYQAEATGNKTGEASTFDRIEFHVFDNMPTFDNNDIAFWCTEKGWTKNVSGTSASLYKDFSYCADIFGGARPFEDDESIRTSGGLRFSTLASASSAFTYKVEGSESEPQNFANIIYPSASSVLFTGTSGKRRSVPPSDSPYFGIALNNSSYKLDTIFSVSYDESKAYITDLAGNRLKSASFTTIDRTSPDFNLTIAPIGNNELFVVFVKKIVKDSVNFAESFDFVSIDNGQASICADLSIDTNHTPEFISYGEADSDFTCVKFYLNRNVTLEDVKTLYIRLKTPDAIQDLNGNFMPIYSAHALSDFAVNAINPLYAYNDSLTLQDGILASDLDSSWAVHDWNLEQANYGTLQLPDQSDDENSEKLVIVASVNDGTESESSATSYIVYLSDKAISGSASDQYNSDLGESKRIWLPELPDFSDLVFKALSSKNNSNYLSPADSILDEDESTIKFELDSSIYSNWSSGAQISFLFGLTDSDGKTVEIVHSPELDVENEGSYLTSSKKFPLFALRLKNEKDITSFDLWSFKLKNLTSQRGGVTILNNVINPLKGEKTVVEIQNPSAGKVRVFIMTVDGNVVTYLSRGNLSAGNHKFTWNGKNQSGSAVARGMYFVRVIGNGFDET
nr:hypothetical protein [Treponema sp.]